MIYFFVFVIDLLIKLIFTKLIFISLIVALIFFLHNKSQFLPIYFFGSLINDWLLILPFGFTGFYFGLILILIKIINKYLSFEKELIIYLISFLALILFFLVLWYLFFKISLNLSFFILLIINYAIFLIINLLYKNI